jgi:pimeloyl-ACP methyl ester carboxylesterase
MPVVKQLGQSYHCVVPDLLGFGDSEWPGVHYSIALEVECLAEYLNALKFQKVYLVGHSVGGWVAASFALRFPERVKGLVLVSPEGVVPGNLHYRWRWARWLMRRPSVICWGLRLLLPGSRLLGKQAAIERLLQLRHQLRRSPTSCKLLFKRRQAEIRAELIDPFLPQLKIPIMLLQGEHDGATSAHLTQAYGGAPCVTLYAVSGAGEDLLATHPEQVAQLIHSWCNP